MRELRFYATIKVEDDFFADENYNDNMEYVNGMLKELADGCMGSIVDLEIK